MKEVSLPSGATLKITPAPFSDARDLYQAVLRESKHVQLDFEKELPLFIKDFFCTAFSSKAIEKIVWDCMKRCIYNDLKITEDTFEPVEAREDYIKVIAEVTIENITPFLKSLFAEFKTASAMIGPTRK